jgi:hypothetical protein
LGDGDTFDGSSAQTQVAKMANENITVSTVATNATDYGSLAVMQNIAIWGKGRFYRADDPTAIPQVLLKETQQAARRAIINEAFAPAIVSPHPILTGLNTLPQLNGYVATTPKPAAQLVLISHKDDPVLAVWQYGLGRVAAWTSDALGLWTTNWLAWNGSARFWDNLATWTLPSPDSALVVNGQVTGGTGHLTVDLPAGTSAIASTQQQVQARIILPDLSQESVTLQPTAPQRWEANFPALQVGAYLLQVNWKSSSANNQSGENQLTATTGLVVPYSPEFRTQGTDLRFLQSLARAGGGSILATNDTTAAFAPNLVPISAAISLVFWLLALAALLLPVDVALRRLSGIEFVAIGYQWLRDRLSGEPSASRDTSTQAIVSTPLSAMRAKREVRHNQSSNTILDVKVRKTATKATTHQEKSSEVPQKLVAENEPSIAEQLLSAKRKRNKQS